MCDRILGEVGRRYHMFTWLRSPGATGEWLAVDSYYPRARLVVLCRSAPGPHDGLYRELVPAHGLGLLTLDPSALGNDREAVQKTLAAKFTDLEPVPRHRRGRGAEPAEASARAGVTARRPAPEWTPVKVERTPIPRGFVAAFGVLAGLAFTALLIAEVYLGVIVVAFHARRLVLGLAILSEALSRALGTVAAERAGKRGWAVGCAIFGAPLVAWATLVPRRGRIDAEPAPLAGLLALLAGAVALAGVVTGT
jgi:hypothetical protein